MPDDRMPDDRKYVPAPQPGKLDLVFHTPPARHTIPALLVEKPSIPLLAPCSPGVATLIAASILDHVFENHARQSATEICDVLIAARAAGRGHGGGGSRGRRCVRAPLGGCAGEQGAEQQRVVVVGRRADGGAAVWLTAV